MVKTKKHINNFIYHIINNDLKQDANKKICTRFPPEPNGYLHIGHAKSICLNFGIAEHFQGKCHLRFDDTNPEKENTEYVTAIKKDIAWLGFKWSGNIYHTSQYFDTLYNYAIELIEKKLAYVDQLTKEEIRKYRGTLKIPGKNSPYRNQTVNENLTLFKKMKNGEFNEGSVCLRAKIDMASNYIIMRDPVLYRIKFITHYKTENTWCIYPMYDFAHCISDAIEGVTYSLCTLEFQENRQLYNWILKNISICSKPRQYEFSRLNLEYSVMSKRKLKILVKNKIVDGWDDPRMNTISGLRRRGYTPKSIRDFCNRVGITKQENVIQISLLEFCIRKDLNENAQRVMAILNPIKIIIKNFPKTYEEKLMVPNHPFNSNMGSRSILFSREIYIDRSDFCIQANKKYKRLVLGNVVRLRYAYIIKAEEFEKDSIGNITCVYCTYDMKTLNNNCDHKVKGVIHWIAISNAVSAEFRLYDKLFNTINPEQSKDFLSDINKNSLRILRGFVESHLKYAIPYSSYQFEREGYFCLDKTSKKSNLIFNRIVSLVDKNK